MQGRVFQARAFDGEKYLPRAESALSSLDLITTSQTLKMDSVAVVRGKSDKKCQRIRGIFMQVWTKEPGTQGPYDPTFHKFIRRVLLLSLNSYPFSLKGLPLMRIYAKIFFPICFTLCSLFAN